jgi:hypothetical protein
MPEWLKHKNCPHKKKYMAGKRIQPKNLTGREILTGRKAFLPSRSRLRKTLASGILTGVYDV